MIAVEEERQVAAKAIGAQTMKPRDWTLMTVAAAGGERLQPVQLQKALFLIGRNLSPQQLKMESFYTFEPYDYGPFCSDVYSDAEVLESSGLLEISRPPATRYHLYAITPSGLITATSLRADLTATATNYLDRVVAWVKERSFNEIVRAVYEAYPEMKVNSVFSN